MKYSESFTSCSLEKISFDDATNSQIHLVSGGTAMTRSESQMLLVINDSSAAEKQLTSSCIIYEDSKIGLTRWAASDNPRQVASRFRPMKTKAET